MDQRELLLRAAALAQRGRGHVEPNPRVGAIAMQGGRVVGEGWHRDYGAPHAEEAALEDAFAKGAEPDTLVVTLEPCSSSGGLKKRPPCTQLILEAGVQRVLVGALDPDERHRGAGLDYLRNAGVEVLGPFDLPEIAATLDRFVAGIERTRPWVVAKYAMSLDGKTAAASGDARWISGEAALDYAHEQRARSEAIVVGYRTLVLDDPELTVRRVLGRNPLRVIIDPVAATPRSARVLDGSTPTLIVVAQEADDAACAGLQREGVEILRLEARSIAESGRPRLDLVALLDALHARGVRRVLVEGGGSLLAEFFELGLVDQVAAVVAPKLVGGAQAPTPLAGDGRAKVADAWRIEDSYIEELGDCWLIGGFVARDEAANRQDS